MEIPGAAGLKVLIVEDMAYIRSMLRGLLLRFGFAQVVEAASVPEALAELRRTPPDLIVTDWEMPGLTGIDLLKWVRQNPQSRNPATPIILLTAHGDFETVRACRDAGANDFLIKPVAPKRLHESIANLLRNDRLFVVSPDYVGPDRRRADRPTPHERRARTPPPGVMVTPPGGPLGTKTGHGPGADMQADRLCAAIRARETARQAAAAQKPLDKLHQLAGDALAALEALSAALPAMQAALADAETAGATPTVDSVKWALNSMTALIAPEADEISELTVVQLHLQALRAMTRESGDAHAEKIAANLAARLDAWRREQS